MVAVAFFAEDFVEEVGAAVDDEVLVAVVERGVHTAEYFEDFQAIERAVGVPDGAEDFFRAVFRGLVAVFGGDTGSELAFEIADVAGSEELVAAADAEVQVAGGLLGEGEAEGFCFLLGCHGWELCVKGYGL